MPKAKWGTGDNLSTADLGIAGVIEMRKGQPIEVHLSGGRPPIWGFVIAFNSETLHIQGGGEPSERRHYFIRIDDIIAVSYRQ